MHISPDDFVAGLNGEMNRIKADEEMFEQVGKRISQANVTELNYEVGKE